MNTATSSEPGCRKSNYQPSYNPMNHILHNYRSDIALVEIFYRYDEEKNEMVATEIPDIETDFEFTYRAEDHREFTAGRKAGAYFNCKPISNSSIEVYIPLSRCRLGTGRLVHFLTLHTPNGNFPERIQNICVPASTGYILHKGPSESVTTAATSILGSEVFSRVFSIEILHDAEAETPYYLPDGGAASVRTMQRYLSADRDTTQILFILFDVQTGEKSYAFATVVNDCKAPGSDGSERNLLMLGGSIWLAKRHYLLQLTYDKTAEAFDPIVCNLLPSGMAQTTGDDSVWTMSQQAITQELTRVRMDFGEGDRLTLQSANSYTDTTVSDEAQKRIRGDVAALQAANEYTDSTARQTLTDAKAYIDTNIAVECQDREQGDAATLQAGKEYTDSTAASERVKSEAADRQTLTDAKAYIDKAIDQVVNGSPAALDTLKELSDALGNDPNFAATITRGLAGKVDKVAGKQLSTEDFTTELKAKLAGIANNANNYTHPASHPASMITEDGTRRFVTDAEKSIWNGKQDALKSGQNIKTINGQSLLGKGNIAIAGGSGGNDMSGDLMLVRTGKIVGIGQTWQQPLSFTLRIGNYSEELLDPNQYRLVFMFTRKTHYSFPDTDKKFNSGIRWVVPMIASTKQNPCGFPENETYVPITGNQMAVTFPNHFRPKLRFYNSRLLFRQTNNSRLKIGVAIFKYTGVSDPGWYRCSNIYGIEYCLGNRRISDTTYLPKQINTRYIME